jgi:hypothetical protein
MKNFLNMKLKISLKKGNITKLVKKSSPRIGNILPNFKNLQKREQKLIV